MAPEMTTVNFDLVTMSDNPHLNIRSIFFFDKHTMLFQEGRLHLIESDTWKMPAVGKRIVVKPSSPDCNVSFIYHETDNKVIILLGEFDRNSIDHLHDTVCDIPLCHIGDAHHLSKLWNHLFFRGDFQRRIHDSFRNCSV